jgi:tetratricopeptide (TPR) repeat protein
MKSFRNRFGHAAAALSLVTLAVEPRASAQGDEQATSRAHFDEGRRLAASGQYELACPKFEAARKLHTSAGVLLNLADCYDKIGRTASAWTMFGEAAPVASLAERLDDAAEARRRQAVLEPGLVHLSIRVSHEVAGFTLTRDDTEVPPEAWNEPIPVDPGAHELRAQAPGCRPWTMSVSVSVKDGNRTIDVPELLPIQFLSRRQ